MNVLNMINPKNIFDRFVNEFGFRRTVIATTLGASCAFIGFTVGLLVGPDDPNPIKTNIATEAAKNVAKTAVETVTENIVEKENI